MLFIFILIFWLRILLFLDEFLKKYINLGLLYIYAISFILLFLFGDIFLF